VPNASWVKRLVDLGVKTIQLRCKDLIGKNIVSEIQNAIRATHGTGCKLFINDYWELAIELGAYGVHLGQEDLETADLKAIEKSGLRLGISTHAYTEMARALSLCPSYMAVGPIYPTTCKSMRFGPQGLDRLKQFRNLLPCPVVAIGGITLENATDVLATGVECVAVISDITQAKNVKQRLQGWEDMMGAL
jgi:thiamine-phosphate diphosphorylase